MNRLRRGRHRGLLRRLKDSDDVVRPQRSIKRARNNAIEWLGKPHGSMPLQVQTEAAKQQQAEVMNVALAQSFASLRGVRFKFADTLSAAVAAQLDDLC